MQPMTDLPATHESLPATLAHVEKSMIIRALREHRGNMGKAALALGISERIMGLRMKKFGLDYRPFRKQS